VRVRLVPSAAGPVQTAGRRLGNGIDLQPARGTVPGGVSVRAAAGAGPALPGIPRIGLASRPPHSRQPRRDRVKPRAPAGPPASGPAGTGAAAATRTSALH